MRHCLPALLLTLAIPLAHAQDPQLRLARYSSAATTPDLADYAPLETIATVHFPAEVGTVGEALHYTLLRTGYTLGRTDADATHLLALPLPHSHRALGPARVSDLLTILLGPSYAVNANPVDRTIAIARSSAPSAHAEALPATPEPIHVTVESTPVTPPSVTAVDESASEARASSLPAWRREGFGP